MSGSSWPSSAVQPQPEGRNLSRQLPRICPSSNPYNRRDPSTPSLVTALRAFALGIFIRLLMNLTINTRAFDGRKWRHVSPLVLTAWSRPHHVKHSQGRTLILGRSSAAWKKQGGPRYCSSGEEPDREHSRRMESRMYSRREEAMDVGEAPGNTHKA